jgi:DNA-binding CsgD family transcriptional regulator
MATQKEATEDVKAKKNSILATAYEDMCDPWLSDNCDVLSHSEDYVTVYIDFESVGAFNHDESDHNTDLLASNVLDTEPAGDDYHVTVPAVIYDFYEHSLSESEAVTHALLHAHGLSYNEVAEAMEISVETVKTYVSRVSKKKAKARKTLDLLD